MHISSGAPDAPSRHEPWNKGKLVGPKPPLTLQQVWEIRIRLQILNRTRDLWPSTANCAPATWFGCVSRISPTEAACCREPRCCSAKPTSRSDSS